MRAHGDSSASSVADTLIKRRQESQDTVLSIKSHRCGQNLSLRSEHRADHVPNTTDPCFVLVKETTYR
jgi:hypothetical protein